MGVERELIIRMARTHWVCEDSRTWGMSPLRFLDIRSAGLKEVPFLVLASMFSKFKCKVESARDTGSGKKKNTFVPSRFSDNLITTCITLRYIIRISILLHFCICIRLVALQAIQSS